MKRFKTDVHNCVGFIQDPKKLKESVKNLHEKYVQDETVRTQCRVECSLHQHRFLFRYYQGDFGVKVFFFTLILLALKART